jgi:hypothetical protein
LGKAEGEVKSLSLSVMASLALCWQVTCLSDDR